MFLTHLAHPPTNYLVTMTVTDSRWLSANATLLIVLKWHAPNVAIASPTNGAPSLSPPTRR